MFDRMIFQARWQLGRVVAPVLRAYAATRPRTISAMVRIRNEEEYLERAIDSIAGFVDEIVLIDNLSTDSTPSIIRRLQERYPAKVRSFEYPYEVARQGSENLELSRSRGGLRSPHLLANYYNWCLRRCTKGFVVKWDADMVATSAFESAVTDFRTSSVNIRWFFGANLHPDGAHLIAGRPFEDEEPRIFVRAFARYDNGPGRWEQFRSPYDIGSVGPADHVGEPAYVHLRFCKRSPFGHMSGDMATEEAAFMSVGPEPSADVALAVRRWRLAEPKAART